MMNEDMLFATEEQLLQGLEAEQTANDAVEMQKFMVFMSDDLRFGVDAGNVVEILSGYTTTYLPMVPEYIRGIINMRGQMVPIVDIRLRLGKPPKEDCLIIVLSIESTFIGIYVDSVEQMIDVPAADLLPMPAQSTQQLVSGMCSLPDGSGTMMVLECEQLLQHD